MWCFKNWILQKSISAFKYMLCMTWSGCSYLTLLKDYWFLFVIYFKDMLKVQRKGNLQNCKHIRRYNSNTFKHIDVFLINQILVIYNWKTQCDILKANRSSNLQYIKKNYSIISIKMIIVFHYTTHIVLKIYEINLSRILEAYLKKKIFAGNKYTCYMI